MVELPGALTFTPRLELWPGVPASMQLIPAQPGARLDLEAIADAVNDAAEAAGRCEFVVVESALGESFVEPWEASIL